MDFRILSLLAFLAWGTAVAIEPPAAVRIEGPSIDEPYDPVRELLIVDGCASVVASIDQLLGSLGQAALDCGNELLSLQKTLALSLTIAKSSCAPEYFKVVESALSLVGAACR